MSERLVQRMRGFGTTIFAEMSELAVETGALNLGQGFPDTDGPDLVLQAAREAIAAGHNQYPPGRGIPALREAIAAHQQEFYGQSYDSATEVLVTAGATEAITAALLALCEAGDEVVVLEPTYDSYGAAAALAGAYLRPVRLQAPDYALNVAALRAAVTPRTRLLLINSPHNPTGHILDEDECAAIAAVAIEHDLLVVTDEVYEHLTFDGRVHRPLASLPGMRERTITISSAGKTFAVTGWKIGWACAPADLTTAVTTVKQFLTYVNGSAFQPAVALGLRHAHDLVGGIRDALSAQRDLLSAGLADIGLTVHPSQATYFVTVDVASLGETSGLDFCRRLPHRCGVVAVPSQVFYADPAGVETLVRFAFCKRPEVLTEAIERLRTL